MSSLYSDQSKTNPWSKQLSEILENICSANLGPSIAVITSLIKSFPSACELQIGSAKIWLKKADHLELFGEDPSPALNAAAEAAMRAVFLENSNAFAHEIMGKVFGKLHLYDKELACYKKAYALNPTMEGIFSKIAWLSQAVGDIDNVEHRWGEPSPQIWGCKPLVTAVLSDSLDDLLLASRSESIKLHPSEVHSPAWKRHESGRIRLGYLSSDFNGHVVSQCFAGVPAMHNRSEFEVFAFSTGTDDGSAERRRLQSAFDRFHDVRALTDDALAEKIRESGVDILIDLNGWTRGHRMKVLAKRPAPVQAHYLGFPGTLGCKFIDYLITDHFIVPEEMACFYQEKIAYLPGCYQCNDDQRLPPNPALGRADFGLPNSKFVYCDLNSQHKINKDSFDSWMRILHRVPDSVLWLPGRDGAAANYSDAAAKRGISPDRLYFAEKFLTKADHLARYACADLFLDTYPFSAHATASEALWSGLPVLSRVGETFASRVAGSLLMSLGCPELVAGTQEEYEDIAVRLALNKELLAETRSKLKLMRAKSNLFDTRAITRNLEQAYRKMHERLLDGMPPATFSL